MKKIKISLFFVRKYIFKIILLFSLSTLTLSSLYYFADMEPRRLGCFGEYSTLEHYYLNPMMENPTTWLTYSLISFFAAVLAELFSYEE